MSNYHQDYPVDEVDREQIQKLRRRRMSDSRIVALAATTICALSTFIAFFTPNWLASEKRLYGAKFVRLGLWATCFRSFVSPEDYEMVKYYAGCRWIFAEEYQNIKHILMPGILSRFFSINFILNKIPRIKLNSIFLLISRIFHCHTNFIYNRIRILTDCLYLCPSHTIMFYHRERNSSDEIIINSYVSIM